ncbi:hypothetical protein JCM18899A_50620 [Nocardioides sp. AN3]
MSLQRPTITRKTIRTRALLALCLSGSMALAACGSGGKDSATATEGQNATAHSRPKTLYLINPSDANAWAKAFAESYTKVLEDGGVKVTRLQNNFDPVAESQQFTQAISQKPGAIAVFAADSKASIPAIKRAEAAGIPVFNLTNNIDAEAKSALVSNIVSNTEQLGTLAGELLQQGLKDAGYKKANILALTGVASSNVVIDAMAALRKQLASTPEYKIVSVQDTQWDQTNAQQLASQVFAQWAPKGGIQAVYGSNGANVAGAIEAGQKIGLTFDGKGGIVAVSGACFPVDYGNIDGGLEYGAVSESPLDEGKASGQISLDWFNGKAVPANVALDEYTITKANLAEKGDTCRF